MASTSAAASLDSLKLGIVMTGPQLGPNLVHGQVGRTRIDATLDRRSHSRELVLWRQGVPARLLAGAHYGLGLDIVCGLCGHDGMLTQVQIYCSWNRRAAAAATGASTTDASEIAHRMRSDGRNASESSAADRTVSMPKMSVGTNSGSMSKASSSPPRRVRSVRAAPMAPSELMAGVPASMLSISTP